MRTTITISERAAKQAKRLTGQRRLGAALETLVNDRVRIEQQLDALKFLRENPPDVTWDEIKAARRGKRWSA